MASIFRSGFTTVLCLGILACGGESGDEAGGAKGLSDAEYVEKAKSAAEELSGRLLARLSEAHAEGGPAAAIRVCQEEAPEIARQASLATGVRIGRTSHRLRSPFNRPPLWVKGFVEEMKEDPEVAAEPRVFRGPGEHVGVTLPIRMKKMCASCHGTEDEIPDEVREVLDSTYPDDEARGFAEGEIRGIFWVEIPVE